MPSDLEMPGRKVRRNRDGTTRLYWCARADLVKAGYRPETVRLFYDADDPSHAPLIAASCQRMQAEMLAWAAGQRSEKRPHDGTLASLIRIYQHHEASPYRDLKWNTRRTYDQVMDVVEKAFGKRALSALKAEDFRRWYDAAKKPKAEGGSERVRKAHGIISMLRRLFAFGVSAEIPECGRLDSIIGKMRFKQPKRRRVTLHLDHVKAFVAAAEQAGRLSLALGTAIQFETAMRQRDVIGEWAPISEDDLSGIVLRGKRGRGWKRWGGGLTWADLGDRTVVVKETTKTGAMIAHDFSLSPLILALLEKVPPEARVGPLIIDEAHGRPYAAHGYAREWRVVARKAGIPDGVWNMDARAGAITEAEDAGAELDEIRGAVGHTQASTTARYSRGAIGKSRRVASLRTAHRMVKNEP
jgi:hypothetical protein